MSENESPGPVPSLSESPATVHFPEPPPTSELVWHYCGADALKSIITNNELWASSVAFMNDAREAITGSEALRANFERVRDGLPPGVADLLSGSLMPSDAVDPPVQNLETFLLSASLDGDNLSMWRAYGSEDVTYAVGVHPQAPLAPIGRTEELDPHPGPDYEKDRFIETDDGEVHHVAGWDAPQFTDSRWFLAVYDSEQSAEIVTSTLEHIQNVAQRANDGAERHGTTALYLGVLFASLEIDAHRDLAIHHIKDPGFVDEREVRLVMNAWPAWRFVSYRASRLGFVPYIRLTTFSGTAPDYPTEGQHLPIKQICIGPTRYPELAKAGLEQMLEWQGYHEVEVILSKIPFRPV
jgi:hypothetical protein